MFYLALVEVVDHVEIQGFLELPMRLTQRILVTAQQWRQQTVGPVEQLGVQLKRECRLCVVVTVQVQTTQLVHVPDVHLLAVDLTVEVLNQQQTSLSLCSN